MAPFPMAHTARCSTQLQVIWSPPVRCVHCQKARSRTRHVRIVDEAQGEASTSSTRPHTPCESEAPERALLQQRGKRGRRRPEEPARPASGRAASMLSAHRQIARDRERARVHATERMAENLERTLAIDRRKRRVSKLALLNPITLAYNFFHDPVLRFWCGCNVCFAASLIMGSGLFMALLYPSIRGVFMY